MLKSHFLSLAVLATAAVTIMATPARADGNVKVPFGFTVGDKWCPAGTYQIRGDATGKSVVLVGPNSMVNFKWVVMPMPGDGDPNKVALRFDETGSGHVLRSVQYGPESTPLLDVKELHAGEAQSAGSRGR